VRHALWDKVQLDQAAVRLPARPGSRFAYRSPVGDYPEAVGATDLDQWWPTVDSGSILAVPCHLDKRLDGFETGPPADRQVTAALAATGPWQRMAVLHE